MHDMEGLVLVGVRYDDYLCQKDSAYLLQKHSTSYNAKQMLQPAAVSHWERRRPTKETTCVKGHSREGGKSVIGVSLCQMDIALFRIEDIVCDRDCILRIWTYFSNAIVSDLCGVWLDTCSIFCDRCKIQRTYRKYNIARNTIFRMNSIKIT